MGQLIEVAEESLDSRIDEFLDGPLGSTGAAIHQPRELVQRAAVACSEEGGAQRFAPGSQGKQHLEQLQQDVLFPRHRHVGGPGMGRVGAEDLPRLVDDAGATGDDERARAGSMRQAS